MHRVKTGERLSAIQLKYGLSAGDSEMVKAFGKTLRKLSELDEKTRGRIAQNVPEFKKIFNSLENAKK